MNSSTTAFEVFGVFGSGGNNDGLGFAEFGNGEGVAANGDLVDDICQISAGLFDGYGLGHRNMIVFCVSFVNFVHRIGL